MIIENSDAPAEIKRGRPTIYPFSDLLPNQKLIIPGNIDLKAHKLSVHNALNNYLKKNDLDWPGSVRIEQNNIVVYRLQ